MAAAVISQIFVKPRIRDAELKAFLRDEGVVIGYPFCTVAVQSQDHEFRLARIFRHYGWRFEVKSGFYAAYQNVEEIEV